VEGWIRVSEREMKDEEAYQCKTSVSYMCLLKLQMHQKENFFVCSEFVHV
jgi:hypothetical protein